MKKRTEEIPVWVVVPIICFLVAWALTEVFEDPPLKREVINLSIDKAIE